MEYTKNIATTNERAAINRIRNIYRKEVQQRMKYYYH